MAMEFQGWQLLVLPFIKKHSLGASIFEQFKAKIEGASPQRIGDFRSHVGFHADALDNQTIVFNLNSFRVVCIWLGPGYTNNKGEQTIMLDKTNGVMTHLEYDKWNRKRRSGV
jgi:hypothetical protein